MCVCVCVCSDIQFEDIEDYLWRSGMAYNHGIDKQGHNIGEPHIISKHMVSPISLVVSPISLVNTLVSPISLINTLVMHIRLSISYPSCPEYPTAQKGF